MPKPYPQEFRDDVVRVARNRDAGMTLEQVAAVSPLQAVDPRPALDPVAPAAAADFMREQLKAQPWDAITDQMLYGVYYGYSVAELMWSTDGSQVVIDGIRVRNRARFQYDLDYQLRLVDDMTPQGKLMPERKFWTFAAGASFSDNPYGLGLAHSLYWPVFFKRSDIKFWLIFLEKFGMPTTTGRLPGGRIDDASEQPASTSGISTVFSGLRILAVSAMK